MRVPRVQFSVRWLIVAVAILATIFGAEQFRRRRASYLAEAVPHAKLEAFYSDLASDLAGVPRKPPSETAMALLPDGSAVRFGSHGPSPLIYYPAESKIPADDRTVDQLVEMCRREAKAAGGLKAAFERAAFYPWLSPPSNDPQP